jgi:hypothetical protein
MFYYRIGVRRTKINQIKSNSYEISSAAIAAMPNACLSGVAAFPITIGSVQLFNVRFCAAGIRPLSHAHFES